MNSQAIQDRIDALNVHVRNECVAIARDLLDLGDEESKTGGGSECYSAAGELLKESQEAFFLCNYDFSEDALKV